MDESTRKCGFLILLLGAVSAGLVCIFLPLFGGIMWATCLAVIFGSLNQRLRRRLSLPASAAAAITTTLILSLVVLPSVTTAGLVVQEAAGLIRQVRSGDIDLSAHYQHAVESLPAWLRTALEGAGFSNLSAMLQKLRESALAEKQPIAVQILSIGGNALDISINFLVMIYLLFYLLRDGGSLLRRIRQVFPMDPEVERRLGRNVGATIRSVLKGNLIVAAVQGALGGVALMVLGVPASLLWAVVMAFLSLLPAVGAALVWGPIALYFLMTGRVLQGISLIAFGALVIGLVDNLLRPMLVGKEVRMPDYVVLVATVGGMSVFGANGLVIGPVIAALFIEAWSVSADLSRLRRISGLSAPDERGVH